MVRAGAHVRRTALVCRWPICDLPIGRACVRFRGRSSRAELGFRTRLYEDLTYRAVAPRVREVGTPVIEDLL
jgi:hypothetical protein